jgi:hypothetical protein
MTNARLLVSSLALCAGLSLGACQTVGEVVGEGMRATLTGSEEVPTRGDPDGSGMAEVTTVDRTDNLCYEVSVRNIETATAAHIHRGGRGVSGPPVVTLDAPADGESNGCLSIDSNLLDEIERNPRGFYINVHNARYPNGAVRGQLVR